MVLTWRLYDMQITDGNRYREVGEKLLETIDISNSCRGRILDRNGVILAIDQPCHDFCLDYRLLTNNKLWRKRQIRKIKKREKLSLKEATELFEARKNNTLELGKTLAQEVQQNFQESIDKTIANVKRIRKIVGKRVRGEVIAHPILTGLSESDAQDVKEMIDQNETVGLRVVPSHKRFYPQHEIAAHIIGYVGPVFKEDVARFNKKKDEADFATRVRENYRAGDVLGKVGVENMCENILRPRRGYKILRNGNVIDPGKPAIPGKDVALTIDIKLQKKLTDLLRDSHYTSDHNNPRVGQSYRGSIVVVNVRTGEILAMVSNPTYDLNTCRKLYNQLLEKGIPILARKYPLVHRAAGGKFPPASTVKPFVAIAGLKNNAVSVNSEIDCTGYTMRLRSGKKLLRCWNRSGHGPIDLHRAVRSSCNVYFTTISKRIGHNRLTDWLGYYGFGKSVGTGLPEETTGTLGTMEWLRRNRPRQASIKSNKWYISVGQGIFSVSPLQVANAYAALARGGTWKPAHILSSESRQNSLLNFQPPKPRDLDISPNHISVLHRAMHEVTTRGTARRGFKNEGAPLPFLVCAKTGTAQNNIPGQNIKDVNHSWFAGFAPYRNPEIAIAVMIENGGSGGTTAGPIAKKAMRICHELGYITSGGEN